MAERHEPMSERLAASATPVEVVASAARSAPASYVEAKPPEPSPAPLRTHRLTLRALMRSDRDAYVRVLERARDGLEGVIPLIAPGQSCEEAFERQLELTGEGDRRCTAWRRVAVDRDGRLVGAVAIRDIQRGLSNSGDILWWVAADARRQGFGVEIVGAAVRFGVEDLPAGLGLDTITAMVQPANASSKRLARAIGFRRAPGMDADVEVGGRRRWHETWELRAERVARI